RDRMWFAPCNLGHPLLLTLDHCGMNDGVQFRNSSATERSRSKFRAVDAAILRDDLGAKMSHYFFKDTLAGAHQLAGDQISFDNVRAAVPHHAGDGRFSAGQ